jgi:hypothetical protein
VLVTDPGSGRSVAWRRRGRPADLNQRLHLQRSLSSFPLGIGPQQAGHRVPAGPATGLEDSVTSTRMPPSARSSRTIPVCRIATPRSVFPPAARRGRAWWPPRPTARWHRAAPPPSSASRRPQPCGPPDVGHEARELLAAVPPHPTCSTGASTKWSCPARHPAAPATPSRRRGTGIRRQSAGRCTPVWQRRRGCKLWRRPGAR